MASKIPLRVYSLTQQEILALWLMTKWLMGIGETEDELTNTWEKRNVFSYGRQDKGQARPEVLNQLLKTSDRIVQEIDSVEYGLTDIQEYYGNTGGLKLAAEKSSGKKGNR